MFYELRQYVIRPGTRDRWVALMQDQIVPFQKRHGMQIVGCFIVPDDPEAFVWIRRFDDEAQRQKQYDAVYKSAEWLEKIKPQIDEMLIRERMKITLLEPTDKYLGLGTLES
jgi:NIPSNAP